MMETRTERIRIRVTPDELDYLKKRAKVNPDARFKNGGSNFSEYIRAKILMESSYENRQMMRQLENIRYELRKIGTNVNQIAKKVNSGFGSRNDLQDLEGYLERIEKEFQEFRKNVEQVWQSQN